MMIVKISEMMKKRGIRHQKDLANLSGVSAQTLSSLNKGDGRLETVGKLCAALDCQPGDLLEFVPDKITLTLWQNAFMEEVMKRIRSSGFYISDQMELDGTGMITCELRREAGYVEFIEFLKSLGIRFYEQRTND